MAANVPLFTLNDGTQIPSVGMGCWMGSPGGGERVYHMCQNALKHGYRHFDTAFGYGNEEHVGKALRESGVPRGDIYLTTKLPNHHHHRVHESFEESLRSLNCGYIDLYLMHWPQAVIDGVTLQPDEKPTFIDTWKEMEKLLETGKVKSIGVSNFSIKNLERLLPHCTVIPVTNQVELHPCLPSFELKAFCEEKGILLTAYSPLGRPPATPGQTQPVFFTDTTVLDIARKQNISPAQVVLSWGVQRGTIVVPKSENEARMVANINPVTLSDDDMTQIDNLHRQPGMHRSLLTYHGDDLMVFGWTYEQMGWKMKKGGFVE